MALSGFLVRRVEDDGEAEELEAVADAMVQPGRSCCICPRAAIRMLGGNAACRVPSKPRSPGQRCQSTKERPRSRLSQRVKSMCCRRLVLSGGRGSLQLQSGQDKSAEKARRDETSNRNGIHSMCYLGSLAVLMVLSEAAGKVQHRVWYLILVWEAVFRSGENEKRVVVRGYIRKCVRFWSERK